jgi:hypothetical protein
MECCWNLGAVLRSGGSAPGGTHRGSVEVDRAPSPQSGAANTVSHASPGRQLQDAYIMLLGRRQWEWFGTLTFRHDVHPEMADRRLRLFISKLNRRRYGPRWWKHGQGIWWVRALEYQQRGVVHLHVLLAGIEGVPRQTAIRCWRELAGFAKIEPIRNAAAVTRYVSKYVPRGGDLEFGGPPRHAP